MQLKVGETLVLSGLVTEDSQITREGIVFLKDLPVLGTLFSNKSGKGNRTELVIFITPRLLTPGAGNPTEQELQRQQRMVDQYQAAYGAIELID